MSTLICLILLPIVFISFISSQEPSCYTTNRFEYEFNVLHKLDVLEQSRTELISISETLIEQVSSLQNRLTEKDLEIEDLQTRLASYTRMKDPGGSTYVRWGRTTCPETSEIVYDGYAGGGSHAESGAGTNYLCLPKDPEWAQEQSTSNYGFIHGAEYITPGSVLAALQDHDVPCAVCRSNSTNILLVPAKQTCHTGWIREYTGYLLSGYLGHQASKEYIFMDGNPEAIPGTYLNKPGALFYFQKAKCGSLPCQPYVDGRDITCVLCTQ